MQSSRFQLGLIATLATGLGFSVASSDAVGYPAGAAAGTETGTTHPMELRSHGMTKHGCCFFKNDFRASASALSALCSALCHANKAACGGAAADL